MRNTLKHLTLLTRMKDDGLLPALTGSFSEDAIAQACGQVETLQLQERLHIRKTKRIQEELVRVPNFAALYGALCRQEICFSLRVGRRVWRETDSVSPRAGAGSHEIGTVAFPAV